ncbi:MAG: hypothetical protein Ct9H300mP25_12750 [Acidobacteriota bacterium]|nr:MAG: hypothetical protein Ct9H300mP25_12750 [Acidobacteriota bacterium]
MLPPVRFGAIKFKPGGIAWTEFEASSNPSTEDQQEELVQRRDSYHTAFIWGASNFSLSLLPLSRVHSP